MRTIRMMSLLAAPLLLAAQLATAALPARPNIIFILADDLGYGDLGCYGQKKILTPNLDRMAADGVRFTQFYAGSTVCAPSRSVLMTGQHVGHTRVRGNAGRERPQAQMLRDGDVTVAELLKRAGYATGLIGKWGLGMPGDEGVPNRQGFDYFFGYLSQVHAHNHYPNYLWRNAEKVPLPNGVQPVGNADGGYATNRVQYANDLFSEEALKFIERHRNQPFFLYYAPTIPHANNERFSALKDGQEVPDYGPYADRDWPDPLKGQAAMITRLDEYVGRLRARLRELGIEEKTLLFFSSDNGPHKEGGNKPEFWQASGRFRGTKRDLTDGGIRVPLLACWPSVIKPGGVSGHVGYFGDLMATVAELARVKPPRKIDSISFAPALLGRDSKQKRHEYLYWEFHEGGFSQAVLIEGRWKGIRLLRRTAPIAIYDLQTDPGEQVDLAASRPHLVARVASLFDKARTDSPDWPPKDAPASNASNR